MAVGSQLSIVDVLLAMLASQAAAEPTAVAMATCGVTIELEPSSMLIKQITETLPEPCQLSC